MTILDVAIVGAGPAGATAARLLAEKGCRTVLFEAGPLGRDKPCGGGLTARARAELPASAAEWVRACIDEAHVRVASRHLLRFPLGRDGLVWMVCRSEFDRWLAETAVRRGAELRVCDAVVGVQRDGEASPCARDEA